MNKLDTTHSARSQGPVSTVAGVCTEDFSRIRSNNAPFLAARASLLPVISFLGARNTEIGFCRAPAVAVFSRGDDEGLVTDLMSWDFFAVAGVMVGGVFGRAGRVYSDMEGFYKVSI